MVESDLVGGRVGKTLAECLKIMAGCKACRQKSRGIKVNKSHTAFCFGVSTQRAQGTALAVGLVFTRRYVREAASRLTPTECEVIANTEQAIVEVDDDAGASASASVPTTAIASTGGSAASSTAAEDSSVAGSAAGAISRMTEEHHRAAEDAQRRGRIPSVLFHHPRIPMPVGDWRELFSRSEEMEAESAEATTEAIKEYEEFVGEDGTVDHIAHGIAIAVESERAFCFTYDGAHMGKNVTFTFHRHVGMAWASWHELIFTMVHWPGAHAPVAESMGASVYRVSCRSRTRIDVEAAFEAMGPDEQPFMLGTPMVQVFLDNLVMTSLALLEGIEPGDDPMTPELTTTISHDSAATAATAATAAVRPAPVTAPTTSTALTLVSLSANNDRTGDAPTASTHSDRPDLAVRTYRLYSSLLRRNFALYLASGTERSSASFEAQLFGARTISIIDSMLVGPILTSIQSVAHVPGDVARQLLLAIAHQDFLRNSLTSNDFYSFTLPSPSINDEVSSRAHAREPRARAQTLESHSCGCKRPQCARALTRVGARAFAHARARTCTRTPRNRWR